jgi:CHASE1-domain containing sensor protein
MLRTTVVALILVAATVSSARAQEGLPNSTAMTCGQARSFIKARHAVVMATGPITYDRFVSEDILCRPDASAAPAFEPTLDNRQCMIGYYCKEIELNGSR